MIAGIYIAGAIAMSLTLFCLLPSSAESTPRGKAENLLLFVVSVAFWPMFLIGLLYEFFSLWFWEIDDSESES